MNEFFIDYSSATLAGSNSSCKMYLSRHQIFQYVDQTCAFFGMSVWNVTLLDNHLMIIFSNLILLFLHFVNILLKLKLVYVSWIASDSMLHGVLVESSFHNASKDMIFLTSLFLSWARLLRWIMHKLKPGWSSTIFGIYLNRMIDIILFNFFFYTHDSNPFILFTLSVIPVFWAATCFWTSCFFNLKSLANDMLFVLVWVVRVACYYGWCVWHGSMDSMRRVLAWLVWMICVVCQRGWRANMCSVGGVDSVFICVAC